VILGTNTFAGMAVQAGAKYMTQSHKALFYRQEKEALVCELCAHGCTIKDGRRGVCGVRENRGGVLYSLVYGELIAQHIDPIEKKPMFHFLPGSSSYSISTVGCNFHCLHCQNYSISQAVHMSAAEMAGNKRTPEQVVNAALASRCQSISYTYVEPTVFFEFAYDCCVLARQKGLHNIFVSNGYMSETATRMLAPVLSAINIDIKSFSDDFYKKICGARLQPVLSNVRLMKELGVWVEVTTLVIPGLNDSEDELRRIATFIANVDPAIPWHVTGFHPIHKMTDRPPTPIRSLRKARQLGLDSGLQYVYEGNVPGEGGENTFCPFCHEEVISRFGFSIRSNRIVHSRCPICDTQIKGIWEQTGLTGS
jgi:pyruvate formate lyase activating enzyme